MIRRTVAIGAVICAAWAVNAGAQGHKGHADSTSTGGLPPSKVETMSVLKEQTLPLKVTVTGEVIDVTCFLRHGDRGKAHATCAGYCAAQGMVFGILDAKSNQVYLVLPQRHYNPVEAMARYFAMNVKVTWWLAVVAKSTGPQYIWLSKNSFNYIRCFSTVAGHQAIIDFNCILC